MRLTARLREESTVVRTAQPFANPARKIPTRSIPRLRSCPRRGRLRGDPRRRAPGHRTGEHTPNFALVRPVRVNQVNIWSVRGARGAPGEAGTRSLSLG